MIVGCICCIKGCLDCVTCCCCCCRTSRRSRERLRPPESADYASHPYGQPPPYAPSRQGLPGGGSLFPMPERPKYERINDEEQGIRLDNIPKHAYLDGDAVVAEPPGKSDTTPVTTDAQHSPVRQPRTPTAPYHALDEGYTNPTPPPMLLPSVAGNGRASPVRRDYAATPPIQRPSYSGEDSHSGYRDGGVVPYYSGRENDSRRYDDGYRGNGGVRDDPHEQYYYESTRYGGSRNGGFNAF